MLSFQVVDELRIVAELERPRQVRFHMVAAMGLSEASVRLNCALYLFTLPHPPGYSRPLGRFGNLAKLFQ